MVPLQLAQRGHAGALAELRRKFPTGALAEFRIHSQRWSHFARGCELVSFITRTKVSDCSNGYRAGRTSVLHQLVLRQEQFHTSEFLIEAIKRGIPAKEIPVTVQKRLHGHSKKPAVVRYGLGFTNAIVRTWLR